MELQKPTNELCPKEWFRRRKSKKYQDEMHGTIEADIIKYDDNLPKLEAL